MTRCNSFYRKWKQEPNFCGLGKGSAKSIEKYLEFTEDFVSKYGFDEDLIYLNVPANAIKTLVKFKKDSEIRNKAMEMIATTLKSKHAVSRKLVDTFLQITPLAIPIKESERIKMQVSTQPIILTSNSSDISQKNRALINILSSGHVQILQEYMTRENLDSEYAAICNILSKVKDVMDGKENI